MNCQEINFLLDANSPEDLSIRQKQAVDQHFESCQACREAWAAYREVSALQIPQTPQILRSRIAVAVAPNEVRAIRVPFIIGGVLAVGAAVAAAVALRITGGMLELEKPVKEAPLVPARSSAEQERSPVVANRARTAASLETDEASDSTQSRTEHALDPNTIVVVPLPHPELESRRAALFLQFHEEILRRLRMVPGLNVVRSEVVDPFLRLGIPEEQVARNLGAGHLVVLSTTSGTSAGLNITPVDMATGAATGRMGGSDPFDARWPAELESDAARVTDFIKRGLTRFTPDQRHAAITDARAIVLNAALPARERVTALGKLPQTPEARTDAVVAAAVELATIAPEGRASIWRAMYGVDNPYLIEPLIDSLAYDAAEHIRRQAAASLRTFVAEPRVQAALEQAQASDPSEAVREAAQRALLTREEVDQRGLEKLLDETLPPQERLMATSILEGRNVREVPLTKEAARAVFDIGVKASDPGIRGWAWASLGRSDVDDPSFTSVLLDDLANHPNDEVRSMAANALAQYIDDPTVRTALEQAESEASFAVRYAARRALGMVPD